VTTEERIVILIPSLLVTRCILRPGIVFGFVFEYIPFDHEEAKNPPGRIVEVELRYWMIIQLAALASVRGGPGIGTVGVLVRHAVLHG
jgi:hypothetical protein